MYSNDEQRLLNEVRRLRNVVSTFWDFRRSVESASENNDIDSIKEALSKLENYSLHMC